MQFMQYILVVVVAHPGAYVLYQLFHSSHCVEPLYTGTPSADMYPTSQRLPDGRYEHHTEYNLKRRN